MTRAGFLLGPAVVVCVLLTACGSSQPGGDKVEGVAAGYLHTCAVTGSGGVKCWGANESGQLGNGTTTDSSTPVDVSGLSRGVVAIAAGGHHTCAITGKGGVKCWGSNAEGQLGNGIGFDSNIPVGVKGLESGVTAIAAGAGWVCALTSAGGVKCWGADNYGQLGNGKTIETSTPVDVSGLASGVSAISANSLHACALTTAGRVKCWGSTEGTGAPRKTDSNVPVDVLGLGLGVTAITAGGLHACATTSGGSVECWGTNGEGELGNGSKTDSDRPAQVSGLTKGVAALAVGSTDDFLPSHTCALTTEGGVTCWGPNRDGQLGNGSTKDSSRPVEVSGLSGGITAVAVGGRHACAITGAQRLKCWGDNSKGQLGNGSSSNSASPVNVAGF